MVSLRRFRYNIVKLIIHRAMGNLHFFVLLFITAIAKIKGKVYLYKAIQNYTKGCFFTICEFETVDSFVLIGSMIGLAVTASYFRANNYL